MRNADLLVHSWEAGDQPNLTLWQATDWQEHEVVRAFRAFVDVLKAESRKDAAGAGHEPDDLFEQCCKSFSELESHGDAVI